MGFGLIICWWGLDKACPTRSLNKACLRVSIFSHGVWTKHVPPGVSKACLRVSIFSHGIWTKHVTTSSIDVLWDTSSVQLTSMELSSQSQADVAPVEMPSLEWCNWNNRGGVKFEPSISSACCLPLDSASIRVGGWIIPNLWGGGNPTGTVHCNAFSSSPNFGMVLTSVFELVIVSVAPFNKAVLTIVCP